MKTLKKLLLFVVASALLAGCTSYKNVPYMQNPEVVNSYREEPAMLTMKRFI
jgi:polysaccharide biosynthesis/export protein